MSLFYAIAIFVSATVPGLPYGVQVQYLPQPLTHAKCLGWRAQRIEAAEASGRTIGVPGVSYLCLPATDVGDEV